MTARHDFHGRTVFVSGGTSGINLGIADAYAAAGARVAVMSRNAERVATARAQLARHGGAVLGLVGDVRDAARVKQVLTEVHAQWGVIDVLVSGAAGNFLARALDLSPNGFKAVVDIDLVGTFHVLRAAHPFLRQPGASIINISAPQSYNPAPMQVHACAAKAGMDQVMRVLAMEWGAQGIRVNSIVPGPIEGTTGLAKLASDAARARMAQRVPLGRLGRMQDIAVMALFLGSDEASYITGALLPVDGGISLLGARNHALEEDTP
ncbi:MAG: SDR family oxidoreductase [Burkholderiaceae bacterium]|nr:SDR family oxidoreductase [Pseudomonadota bacterium]MBS0598692.1 SDR family oxidoreductase [Pseudomonadota bacterium]MCO5115973.1 SDR family oxidoreductase [Burkholderiaceae bacterium]MCP5216967.1 SDR family oxidoreductase [Burkholderiaceae bacterium]